jgi:hypothetical protein
MKWGHIARSFFIIEANPQPASRRDDPVIYFMQELVKNMLKLP